MKLPFSKRATKSLGGDGPLHPSELNAEFRCLWAVSQFFSVLQRLQLQPEQTRLVDLTAIGKRIDEAREMSRPLAIPRLAAIRRDLGAARNELNAVDATIPVSIMRRFFERLGRFDRGALGDVLRYYLAKKEKSLEDRDKIDLLATRYGTFRIDSSNDSASWRSVDGLSDELARLQERPEEPPLSIRERTLEDLRDIRRTVFSIATFGDLIERKIVSSVREYKAGLGDLLYAPSVLAEVVETNVAVHNKFQELYQSEMARLQVEAARLERVQEDVHRLLPALDSHRALGELGAMTVQMQQLLQEVKKDLAEHVIVDRNVRIMVEKEGVPLRTLVESCEEALRNTAAIVTSLTNALHKAEVQRGSKRR